MAGSESSWTGTSDPDMFDLTSDGRKYVIENKISYRDREEPHSSPLPPHAAYGSVLRESADPRKRDCSR